MVSSTFAVFLLSITLITFGDCSVIGPSAEPLSLLRVLQGNKTSVLSFDSDGKNFDIFRSLFAVTSQDHKLEEDIPEGVTVFAPDDDAFRRAARDLGLPATSELATYESLVLLVMRRYRYPITFLTRLLYYHVVPGRIDISTVRDMPSWETWEASSRFSREGDSLVDRNPILRNAKLDPERTNISARNGVIHVIDYVLFPELVDVATRKELDCESAEPTEEFADATGDDSDEISFSPFSALLEASVGVTEISSEDDSLAEIQQLSPPPQPTVLPTPWIDSQFDLEAASVQPIPHLGGPTLSLYDDNMSSENELLTSSPGENIVTSHETALGPSEEDGVEQSTEASPECSPECSPEYSETETIELSSPMPTTFIVDVNIPSEAIIDDQ